MVLFLYASMNIQIVNNLSLLLKQVALVADVIILFIKPSFTS